MVEVNPQEVPSESTETETNIFVAQTVADPEARKPVVLPDEESWIVIRPYPEDALKDSDIEGLPEGNVVFAEMHGIPKDVAIELLEMVIDTIRDGEEMSPEQMFVMEEGSE